MKNRSIPPTGYGSPRETGGGWSDFLTGRIRELAGFCLQQAVEKFLKAFLLSHGWPLRRIHDLGALLDEAIIYNASFEDFRAVCQKITAFYFVERYPLVVETGMTEEGVCPLLFS
jgi:HEPN domain-containing protein